MVSSESKNMEFFINPKRFDYLLELYHISKQELLEWLNKDIKKHFITLEDLDAYLENKQKVKSSFLKKIDKIFDRGITWYISQMDIPKNPSSSIFFRKDSFNAQLNFESKKKIVKYEELKLELEVLTKQINFEPQRLIGEYKRNNDPREIAVELRKTIGSKESELIQKKQIRKANEDRDYLQNLIRVFEHFNIFVFEFVDTHNKKRPEKEINFNGFYLNPNIIVIKRQQKYLRREIFTLIHEFAHLLLDAEEVDDETESNDPNQENKIERWCNDFAYYFLMNGFETEFSKLDVCSPQNNYQQDKIKEFYNKTYLSQFALLTRLKIEDKISVFDYYNIVETIRNKEREYKIKLEKEKERKKEQGRKEFGRNPQGIKSHLFEEIVKTNFFSRYIRESELRELLNIKQNQSIDEVIY